MFGVAQWREHPVNGVQMASTIDTGGKVAGSSPAVNPYKGGKALKRKAVLSPGRIPGSHRTGRSWGLFWSKNSSSTSMQTGREFPPPYPGVLHPLAFLWCQSGIHAGHSITRPQAEHRAETLGLTIALA